MNSVVVTLCGAIQSKRLIRFRYQDEDKGRTVEPHLVGESAANHEVLFAWYLPDDADDKQLRPTRKASGWRTYVLADIRDLVVLESTFDQPRDGFNLNDRNIVRVRCSVSALRVVTE